jgi:capsular exopolysaccharide synthesis family protein
MNGSRYDTMGSGPAGPTSEVDPRAYLRILWRWKWIFVAIVIAIPVATYLVVSREHKVYQSTALLEIQPITVDTAQYAGSALSSEQVLSAVAELLTTTPVAHQAATLLHPPPANPDALLGHVTATPDLATGFISVSATGATPQEAANIANAFASAVAVTRAQQAVSSLNSAIAQATQQLNALPAGDHSARAPLLQEIQQDQALRVAQGANAQIVQPALPDAAPVSPHVTKAVALALVAALLLALGAVALAETADRRLRDADDLEPLTGRPLLSQIPKSAFSGKAPTPGELEAFRTLNATLTYFNVDQPKPMIVVTSAGKGEGKTTVAIQLAIASARAGNDVILVDADLRHPSVAERLNVRPGMGIESVLVGKARLEGAVEDHEVTHTPREGSLRILPAFQVPPNPGQLIASKQMRMLLEALASVSDTVIIDTSPALLVADALPLFEAASGVLIVARVNHTHKKAIRRLQWLIESAKGTVLGTVATDTERRRSAGRYDYAYYGVPAEGAEARGRRRRRRRDGSNGAVPAGAIEAAIEEAPVSDRAGRANGAMSDVRSGSSGVSE